jgi:hypothetical protein
VWYKQIPIPPRRDFQTGRDRLTGQDGFIDPEMYVEVSVQGASMNKQKRQKNIKSMIKEVKRLDKELKNEPTFQLHIKRGRLLGKLSKLVVR